MLSIFNKIKPFVEDCYKELGVREYARIIKISPPTASKILKNLVLEGLLKERGDRGYLLFRANRENLVLRDLSLIYWRYRFEGLVSYLNDNFNYSPIILFGSLSKLESREESDIDLVVLTKLKKKIEFSKFEKELKRQIQLFQFRSLKDIPSKELKNNVIKGYVLHGEIK